jgi:DNA-binding transcriptional regulator YiaG
MTTVLVDHDYRESGLDGVTLMQVPLHQCSRCGEESLELSHVEELHRALALLVAGKPGALGPPEVRFLRACLGDSDHDFARRMGVSPEVASRWSSDTNPMRLSGPADRLLRLLIALGDRVGEFAVAPGEAGSCGQRIALCRRGAQWVLAPAPS